MSNDDRWQWLEDIRPQTLVEFAATQLAKILFDDFSAWPPQVQWPGDGAGRYQELFEPDASRPSAGAFNEALKRARWDLARDFDAIEHYDRNHSLEKACPEPYDRLACVFIQDYVTEALFELIERTENRIKRLDAITCLDQLAVLLQDKA